MGTRLHIGYGEGRNGGGTTSCPGGRWSFAGGALRWRTEPWVTARLARRQESGFALEDGGGARLGQELVEDLSEVALEMWEDGV